MDPDQDMDVGQNGNFAQAFRGRNTAMTAEELRRNRENRAADTLRMKDKQIEILSEQNGSLLAQVNKVICCTIYSYCLLILHNYCSWKKIVMPYS